MFRWEVHGYSWLEMQYLSQLVRRNEPLFIKYSMEGGVVSADDS